MNLWSVINSNLLNFSNILSVIVPILLSVAFMTIIERKLLAAMQRRLGPTDVGYFGILQPFSDALKLILKESVIPAQSNKILFYLAPVVTLVFSLLGWAIIPFGQGLVISDWSMGILYTLALSSLAVYGVLFAGWSANSKYAFLGSKWPIKDVNLYYKFILIIKHFTFRNSCLCAEEEENKLKKQTICEKFLLETLIDTLCVTPYNWGSKVKILLKGNNSQVTKTYNSWVGTSEAIRLLSILKFKSMQLLCFNNISTPTLTPSFLRKVKENKHDKNNEFTQWLAGLIDGDGCFHLTKKGYASLEITMDLRDEHALQIIKNVYGGSIILVSGAKALRYRLRHKAGFLSLVQDINGKIRNSNRLMQLNKILIKYEISLIYPKTLTYNDGWLSGFFDADGSITLNYTNGQLAITLTQKTRELLEPLIELYGGNIYIDRTSNNFKWYITKKEDIFNLIEYFKQYPPRSLKKNRLHLVSKCYELKDIGAHKASSEKNPLIFKSWIKFKAKWDLYEYP
jgi:hypothetical protein